MRFFITINTIAARSIRPPTPAATAIPIVTKELLLAELSVLSTKTNYTAFLILMYLRLLLKDIHQNNNPNMLMQKGYHKQLHLSMLHLI